MSSVDSRIVTMKFDNAQFEANARTSMSTLDKLKASLNFGSIGNAASKTLGGIQGLFGRFGIRNPFSQATAGAGELQRATQQLGTTGLAPLEGGITGISNKFLAMSTIAITALSNITTKAMTAGGQIVKSLTIQPISTGLKEYETNLNSIQTILANTSIAGTGLKDVNHALDELNHYSDKTIYNFSEMARNIGTFTAAGVDLDTSVASIKGIANLAALSGSNSQQASTAMYQLSQEIAAGRVSLMGWNSVVNAGMGGSVFQRALAETAVAMGEIDSGAVKLQGRMKNVTIDGVSFRESIMAKPGEVSWLTSDVLTNTLQQFTNDMSKAELAAMGFNNEQIKAIQNQAKMAEDAATKVKTLTGVLDTAKEVAASGWAETWRTVFGDFKEARTLFTNVSNTVNGVIGGMSKARNSVLEDWKKLGGRDLVIEGLANAFEALKAVLAPVAEAFRDIFPAKTAEDLIHMSESFVSFTEGMMISETTAENLRRTFSGVFSIFSIIGKVIGGVAAGIGQMFGAVSKGSGGFLAFTGGIGDALTALNNFLAESDLIKVFFTSLGSILSVPIRLLGGLGDILGNLFGGFDSGAADKVVGSVEKFGDAAGPLQSIGEGLGAVFEKVGDIFSNVADKIGDALSHVGDLIANAITPETFSASLDVINTGLLAGIVIMIRKFFTQGMDIDLTGGLFDGIKETLGAATGALQDMQTNLKADTLLKIAFALGILTASLVVLAMIDGKKLAKALTGMSIGFAALTIVMVALTKYIDAVGTAKLPIIAAAMLILAAAILVLSLSLKVMASIDTGDMIKSLAGLAALFFILDKSITPMAANVGGMLRLSAALLILGIALNAIAIALKVMASLSWEEMARGLVGVAGSLAIIAGAMKIMPKNMVFQAAAILALGVALNAIGTALKIFASMSWEEMAKGLTTLAGALVIIALAMQLMPINMLITAAGLILVGVALNLMGNAIQNMGSMSWEEIAKGLVTLAGALVILAVGLTLMSGTLFGAAALVIAAGALAVLTPVLLTMGAMDWMTILKSLTMLAGVFVVLGLAGVVLAPVVPVIIALAAALVLIGAGLALAGVGALAFATSFALIVATGSAGVQIMAEMLSTVIQSIPKAMSAFGRGVVNFVKAISQGGPQFVNAMAKIISNMLDAVIKNVPKMGKAFMTMLNTGLKVVVAATPKIVNAGFKLIIGFLNAIDKNIGKIITIAASIIVKFLNGIARNLPRVIQAGVNLIIKFINGVSNAIDNNSGRLGEAGARLGLAIVRGIANGISSAAGAIRDAAVQAAHNALEAAKDKLGIGSPSKVFRDEVGHWIPIGMAEGIRDQIDVPAGQVERMGRTTLDTLQATMRNLDSAFKMEADVNPTITPVLDLSQLTREANRMNGILGVSPIRASLSYRNASDIAVDMAAQADAKIAAQEAGVGKTDIKIEQNNYSPKPLDPVEIYRNTKSVVALAKEGLTK